jgi:ubiquinone/menaquinone biosynthesis C-methylase UbiE
VKAYYHARAGEYDDWWLGRGLYADRDRPGWEEELEQLAAVVAALPPVRTLDVACGTGRFLTRHLRGEVVGLDHSEAMLEIAREEVPDATFVQGDALELPFADGEFDRVFTSYFYCHLEEPERVRFLAEARRVAPELVVVGTRRRPDLPASRWEERVLLDGSRWKVFKRYFNPAELIAELGGGEVLHVGKRYFLVVRSP